MSRLLPILVVLNTPLRPLNCYKKRVFLVKLSISGPLNLWIETPSSAAWRKLAGWSQFKTVFLSLA